MEGEEEVREAVGWLSGRSQARGCSTIVVLGGFETLKRSQLVTR